jgi:2-hydroxy-3-keto-5-methylthiopentenyl-1-phosphate phosphatase
MYNLKSLCPTERNIGDGTWDIFCDFDGTISLADITDTLLESFATSAWQEIEQAWQAGAIGSRECLARQIPLLDMSRSDLDLHLDALAIDADFPAFVAQAQARGHRITVVSDGLDYAIRRIMARYELSSISIVANSLQQQGERAWQLTFPNFNANCLVASGNCKCATVDQIQSYTTSDRRSLLIGDGTSDFCVAQKVDFVFAKHKLIDHCTQRNLPHFTIQGFADARHLLEKLDRIVF